MFWLADDSVEFYNNPDHNVFHLWQILARLENNFQRTSWRIKERIMFKHAKDSWNRTFYSILDSRMSWKLACEKNNIILFAMMGLKDMQNLILLHPIFNVRFVLVEDSNGSPTFMDHEFPWNLDSQMIRRAWLMLLFFSVYFT